jgi:hypothetical protein
MPVPSGRKVTSIGASDSKLREILNYHLKYELDQLVHALLVASVPFPIITNAGIESWCIHARALDDFFQNKRIKKSDVAASDFTEAAYQARFVTNLRTGLRDKINQQIAHITRFRTKNDDEKIRTLEMWEATPLFLDEAVNFGMHLSTQYLDDWVWTRPAFP